jgi:hypothetical protein
MDVISKFSTRLGGEVTITVDDGDIRQADCNACGDAYNTLLSNQPEHLRVWAQEHARTCMGIPAGYIDYAAKTVEHLNLAFTHLARTTGGEHEQRMGEACLRAAEVYAQLDRTRKAA